MNDDEIDMYTRELRYGPVVNTRDTPKGEDKGEQDFRMIISLLDDMLYSYSHKYQDKKDMQLGIINSTIEKPVAINLLCERIRNELEIYQSAKMGKRN